MRIGIDARELLGRPTGVGRYLAELAARWTRDDRAGAHELVLFAPSPLADRRWVGTSGARVTETVVPGGGGTAWEQWHLARAAAARGLDVFFAPAYTAPLRLRVPTVLAMHDVSFAAHPEWFRWREGLRRRLLARAAAARAAAILTLTAFSKREVCDHLGVAAGKVRVIAPAVDAHPCFGDAPGATETGAREPIVLYVGSIFPREDPARIAAASGVAGRVTLLDYLDDAALGALYARASAFAFLSAYEGFGLTPLEAARAGVPPVVLDTEVAREAYGDAALYVTPGDEAGLAAALAALLEDAALRARLREAGARTLARYSWDRAARETLDAITGAARTA
jgi:glycosyltransferase involved in cell wall biosynthesis